MSFSLLRALLLTALLGGCIHSERSKRHSDQVEQRFSSSPPAFLAGPAGVLLTNVGGFSAHVEVAVSTPSNEMQTISGELLGLGGQLVFTPRVSGVYYIWNVREHGGYILNQPLLGCAPVNSPVEVMSVAPATDLAGGLSEKVNGHLCKRADVILTVSAGPSAQFTVWRASDLNGFPLRIKSVNGGTRFALDLSDVRLAAPPGDIFLPPPDFTRYPDPETMMTELMTRKATLKKGGASGPVNDYVPEASRGRRPSPLDR